MPDYRFHHVHLHSPDPVKTAEFYQEALNAEMVSKTEPADGNARVELKLGGTRVLIMKQAVADGPAPSPAPTGLDHLGLRTDDLDASVAELKAHGAKFRNEIIDFAPGVRIAFFWAPENVLVELVEVKTNPQ